MMLTINLTGVLCWYLHWALLHWFSKKVRTIATCQLRCLTYLFLVPHRGFFILTFLFPIFPFDPPRNIRKPLVFWCFQEDQKGISRRKKLRVMSLNVFQTTLKCFRNMLINPFHAYVSILCPWKQQKIKGFLVFEGRIKWEHWPKMG